MENNFDFDIEKYVQEQIEKQLTDKAKTAPVEEPPRPITVDLDGTKYTFNSEAELSSALGQFRQQAQEEIRKAQTAAAPPPPKPTQGVSGDDKPRWDMEKFVSLMTSDPVAAFDYVDSHRYFDGKVDNASKVIKQQLAEAEMIKKTLAVEQFRQAHPEFPIVDPAATTVVDQVRTQLGLPFTVAGLEAAYYMALNTNPQFKQHVERYQQAQQPQYAQQPPAQPQTQPQNPYQYQPQIPAHMRQNVDNPNIVSMPRPQNNPYLMAPPSLTRNTEQAPPPNQYDLSKLESLSADELEKILLDAASRQRR